MVFYFQPLQSLSVKFVLAEPIPVLLGMFLSVGNNEISNADWRIDAVSDWVRVETDMANSLDQIFCVEKVSVCGVGRSFLFCSTEICRK